MATQQLTGEMRSALRTFARAHGRYWKRALSDLWTSGRDEGVLRRVRNTIGPSGLIRLKAADLEEVS